jgi:hypothetical protein
MVSTSTRLTYPERVGVHKLIWVALRGHAHSACLERQHTTRRPQHPDRCHRERRCPSWPKLSGETDCHRWKCRKR